MKSGIIKQTPFFFLLLVIGSTSTTRSSNLTPKSNTQFIKTSCTKTTYPKLCFTTLSSHANKIQTNSELLTKTAIDVALSSTETTSNAVASLLKGGQAPHPSGREVGAVTDCIEELRESMNEMKKSMSEMKRLKMGENVGDYFDMIMSNIETWVSAALTNEDSCMEGFGAMDGDVKVFVRQHVVKIAHLTSNALALVNAFANLHG